MKNKRILSFLFAIVVLVGSSFSAFAALPPESTVSPLYIEAKSIVPSIAYSGNNATAKATISTYSGCTVKVTLTIQSYSSAGWTDYATFPTQTVSTIASIPKSVSNTSYNIPDGYYRTSAYFEIYMNGVFVESDTVTCSMKYKG